MIRFLLRLLFGKGASMVVDETGSSYRQEALRALMRAHATVEKRGDAESLKVLQGILKDFHDFEYAADRSEAAELRGHMEKLEQRLAILEGLAGNRRIEPNVRRIAPS